MVLYDADEKLAIQVGNNLSEKGVENVYILTNGMFAFGRRYPELVTGTVPQVEKQHGSHTKKSPGGGTTTHRLSATNHILFVLPISLSLIYLSPSLSLSLFHWLEVRLRMVLLQVVAVVLWLLPL